jgi:hypothetical protein
MRGRSANRYALVKDPMHRPLLVRIGKNINLRPVTVADAEFILSLRLDAERAKHLSATGSDVNKQRLWIDAYKIRQTAGMEFYFIIEDHGGAPLGTVRLYDFVGESFCWGSWILRPESPASASIESALQVYELGFFELGFTASHFDVRKENSRVVAFHKRLGAIVVREDNLDYFFEYEKEAYTSVRERYKKYL